MTKILIFPTLEEAQTCLEIVSAQMRAIMIANGYTANGDGVLSKNAATGEDAPEAPTTCWASVEVSPDGRFYFISPTIDPIYAPIMSVLDYVAEVEQPEEWGSE